jgi:hypothetical protein
MHLVLGCISSVVIWLACWIDWRVRHHPAASLPTCRRPFEAVAVLLVGLTRHLGGFLTGVNGPGSTRRRDDISEVKAWEPWLLHTPI